MAQCEPGEGTAFLNAYSVNVLLLTEPSTHLEVSSRSPVGGAVDGTFEKRVREKKGGVVPDLALT